MKNQEQLISDIASEALRKWGLIKHTGATDEHLLELFRMVAREASEKVSVERDELLAVIKEFTEHFSDRKQYQLGNGFAYSWCNKARALLAKIKGGSNG